MERNRAVFLDLNGTLVLPLKPESLKDLKLIPGADIAVRRLVGAGFVCPVVTVQSRIEKGLFTESEFRTWFAAFFDNLKLDVPGPYVCPHRYNHPCPCEKPKSFLYRQAAKDLSLVPEALDLSRSYTIGDSVEDVEAACRFGGTGCLVKTGWAAQKEVMDEAQTFASFIGESIVEAVDWILGRELKILKNDCN